MKTGRTLTELAMEIERQVKSKKDYLANTQALSMAENEGSHVLSVNGGLVVNDLCHEQIAARLNIPKKYYDTMRIEAPGLLTTNVNHWFKANPEKG